MKTNLVALAVAAATLTSFAALADDCDTGDGVHVSVGVGHSSRPVEPSRPDDGRYELRDTQRWIPARYEQVTVQQCREKRHGHGDGDGDEHGNGHGNWNRQRCYPVTETRLVPGYYQTVQEWVFIPAPPRHPQYSQYPGTRPPMFGQGRIGIRIGTR